VVACQNGWAYYYCFYYYAHVLMKKRSETQTLHAGCSKAEPKKFRPAADPLVEARDSQNLISWRWSLPVPTNPVWWRSMHAISTFELSW